MRLKADCDLLLDGPGRCPTVTLLRPRCGDVPWLCNERLRFDPARRPG